MKPTPSTWTLTIDRWHPTPLNRLLGVHFGTRSKRKRADRDLVAGYFTANRIPRATGKRRLTLRITLRPRQRACDPDAYHKSLCDALKACGAIQNDNRQSVELGEVTFDRGTATAWGTTIVLEDLDDRVPEKGV